MCSCHSILECCVTFSGVKLSIRSFVLFLLKFIILMIRLSHVSRQKTTGKNSTDFGYHAYISLDCGFSL